MNTKRMYTTKHLLAAVLLGILSCANLALAHGGFDHVMGTVVKVTGSVVTIKTAKGDVDVTLNDKTTITKGDQKAAVTDLTVGVRVVVDIPEGAKDKIAHSIKIGTPSAGTTATHQ